jgi:uncharacterized phiE125 gp8 family phage protein
MDLRRTSTPLTRDEKIAIVDLQSVKRQGRITFNDQDEYLYDCIEGAYDWLCDWCNGLVLHTEEFEWHPEWGAPWPYEIPVRPIAATGLISFEALLPDGSTYSAVDPIYYYLSTSTDRDFARIWRSASWAWPSYYWQRVNRPYRIRFEAGFGTVAEDVPAPLRRAIRMLALDWYWNREETSQEGRTPGQRVVYGLRSLAAPWRVLPDHS